MTPSRPKQRTGLSPEWAKLPKRRCDDCNAMYKPKKPLREGERGFCSPNCRKSYHKHGGAYRKLRSELEKMIDRRLRTVIQEELRKYAQYARIVEDFGPTLRIPAQSNPALPSNR